MGLMDTLKRIPKIMEANINDLLNKCEDPEKMINQMLIDCKKDVAEVLNALTSLKADLEVAEKDLAECNAKINRKMEATKLAVQAGNDADARKLIQEKQLLELSKVTLQQNVDMLQQNVTTLEAAYNKRVDDLSSLEAQKDAAVTKLKIADAQDRVNGVANKAMNADTQDSFNKYARMADKRLAESNARAELTGKKAAGSIEDKYLGAGNTSVDAELAAIKQQMGV